ncbi:hypothetical protein GCM10007862_33870 [Dyella lipolytica]|uniref:Uncharacterized protein n=1 Tax=Dyella lipolytica TaxID=1867835 RepID=A0ABW8IWQ9_9GAMM|nr:hypothetical protein [Dyella lipolytica]GLQ48336.1 hypothetical protein GCM10007862_33870 [Dyella lipolytica]
MTTNTPKPLSAAEIHSVYAVGVSSGVTEKSQAQQYKRSSHNSREPGHPGSPPPRLPIEPGKRRR